MDPRGRTQRELSRLADSRHNVVPSGERDESSPTYARLVTLLAVLGIASGAMVSRGDETPAKERGLFNESSPPPPGTG